jgi:general secretion pathway protein K
VRRERGIALVAVLWFVVLLSLMALGVLATSRGGSRQAQAAVDRARAEALADAGVMLAITALVEPARRPALQTGGREVALRLGADTVAVAIQDEGGRIDLNEAEAPLLRGLFLSAGVAPDKARALADAVVDWRDEDQVPEPAGAEAEAYRAAGLVHGPANHRFYRTAELRQVLGMSRALFRKVAPSVTVYSHNRDVDTAVAPPSVRAALEAAGLPTDSDANRYRAWSGNRSGGAQLASRTGGAGRTRARLPESTTDTYAVRVDARLADGGRFVRTAIVFLTGDAQQPYLVYGWTVGDD